jgi:hypothetical protein
MLAHAENHVAFAGTVPDRATRSGIGFLRFEWNTHVAMAPRPPAEPALASTRVPVAMHKGHMSFSW